MEAILALEDGRVFQGYSLGVAGNVTGEVVFNTGMTGYQEILTDPSYRGQIVTLTVPHVGNTGVNDDDPESQKPQVSGLIVRDACAQASSWRAVNDLGHYLKSNGIVGLSGIDTRALTRHLRTRGVLRGCLDATGLSADEAVRQARDSKPIEQVDLVADVTCERPYPWKEGRTGLLGLPAPRKQRVRRIVALDYGVKRNILRLLSDAGMDVTVVPATTGASDILALRPEGVFLSNGPGDPASYRYAIATIEALVGKVPLFGICLGHQLLALALGGRTYKLKFGHRGINHPVREEMTGRVAITSQNHGYAVDEDHLPQGLSVSHRSLYDGTVEGLVHDELPVFTVQFHPEAAPGTHDTWDLFGRFHALIEGGRRFARR